MPELSLENPVVLEEATHQITDPGLMTLAAFLLAAGVWYDWDEPTERLVLVPDELRRLGLSGWRLLDRPPPPRRFDPYASVFMEDRVLRGPEITESTRFHNRLGQLIWRAFESRTSVDLAHAVMVGTYSPDPLVRICALTSAFELFNFEFGDLIERLTRFDFSRSDTASVLAQMLLARSFSFSVSASGSSPPAIISQEKPPGLVLIHGTNFPPNRPIWSVPGVGPLFNHIAGFRTDIYGGQDYFRWEGGYSDYAREVASMNLDDWVQRRSLSGLDAVTHSHGGNVLMATTKIGINFGKVVFLSCPVRWSEYQPLPGSIRVAQSVRIHFDFVILADRASQRFPPNTIPEDVLPLWFVGHSVTCEPSTWQRQALDKYIR